MPPIRMKSLSHHFPFMESFLLNFLLTSVIFIAFLPQHLRFHPTTDWQVLSFAFASTFILYVFFYFPLSFIQNFHIHRWIAAFEAFRYLFLLVDLATFKNLGVHLYDNFVFQNFKNSHFFQDIGFNIWSLLGFFVIFFLFYGLQILFFRLASPSHRSKWFFWPPRWLQKGLLRHKTFFLSVKILFFLLLLLACIEGFLSTSPSHKELFAKRLPLYEEIVPYAHVERSNQKDFQHLKQRKLHLRYPLKKYRLSPKKKLKKPNIILFAVESLRGDMLNPQDMPHLTRWSQQLPLLTSKAHYSGGHQTWEGLFSLIYSLSGHYRYTFKNTSYNPYPIVLLKQLGYRTVAISSSGIRYSGYYPLVDVFDRFHDLSHRAGDRADRQIKKIVLQEFERQRRLPPSRRQPLFIFVFYYSSHYPFYFPEEKAVFKPYLPQHFNQLLPPKNHHQLLWNRYRNAVHYVDSEIDQLLKALEPERRASQLAWAFVGDHGEEFWDHGLYGHAARRLNNARTRTPMLLYFPHLPAKRVPLSSHVDIFPTLFDAMGLSLNPRFYSSGRSLLRKSKLLYVQVNGYNFPASPIFTLITPHLKIFARRTPHFEFELNEVLDIEDRRTQWQWKDIQPVIHNFIQKINRFTPNYRLFHSFKIIRRKLIGYPFPFNEGPIRSPKNPQLHPWDRAGDFHRFITRQPPKFQYPLHVKIGNFIEVVGYNLGAKKVRLGDIIFIEYIFRCLKTPPKNWTLFFHLLLKQKPGFQNVSHIPVLGHYPVWQWQKGEYIRDSHRIRTHVHWKKGIGEIRLGLYNKKTHRRAKIHSRLAKKNSLLITKIFLQNQ